MNGFWFNYSNSKYIIPNKNITLDSSDNGERPTFGLPGDSLCLVVSTRLIHAIQPSIDEIFAYFPSDQIQAEARDTEVNTAPSCHRRTWGRNLGGLAWWSGVEVLGANVNSVKLMYRGEARLRMKRDNRKRRGTPQSGALQCDDPLDLYTNVTV